MLLKLLKHDIKNSYKDYMYLYMAIIAYALVIPRLIYNPLNGLGNLLVGFPTIILMLGGIFILFRNVLSFINRRLYSEAGYFTFSLPAKTWQIVLSKVLTITFWMIVTSVIVLLGLGILSAQLSGLFKEILENIDAQELYKLWNSLFVNVDWIKLAYQIAINLIGYAGSVLLVIFSMGVVRSSLIKSRKFLWSVGIFFTITWAWEIVKDLVYSIVFKVPLGEAMVTQSSPQMANWTLLTLQYQAVTLGLAIVFFALAFMATNWLLEKKLQL